MTKRPTKNQEPKPTPANDITETTWKTTQRYKTRVFKIHDSIQLLSNKFSTLMEEKAPFGKIDPRLPAP